jgi:hypothetical protein
MSQKNRTLQRLPPEGAQQAVLRRRLASGHLGTVVSADPCYGSLRAILKHLEEADGVAPRRRGPKPKRRMLLRILDVLEADGLPIRTGDRSPIVSRVAAAIGLSEAQARDRLHQLADMAERLEVTGPAGLEISHRETSEGQ